jgi:anti-anti-sigma factor
MGKIEINIAHTDDGLRLAVGGEFTIATSDTIKRELVASSSREGNEILDLRNVSMMDAVGIQLAYAWKKALKKNNRTGIVICPELETIKDLFVKTGITQIL